MTKANMVKIPIKFNVENIGPITLEIELDENTEVAKVLSNAGSEDLDYIFKDNRMVPDVCRGDIVPSCDIYPIFRPFGIDIKDLPKIKMAEKSKYNDVDLSKTDIQNFNIRNGIVLILESPHQHEFDPEFNPRGPAQKDTGQGIELCISHVINILIMKHGLEILKPNVFKLIICNPVQYQASLHNFLSKHNVGTMQHVVRDNVWMSLFGKGVIQTSFLERIIRYQPFLVINACTGGQSSSVTLKSYVREAVQGIKEINFIYTETHHPSYWHDFGIINPVKITRDA